jgi:hypothetical protein
MKRNPARQIIKRTLLALAVTLCALPAVAAQTAAKPKRLAPPATVRGFIGGESHDAYVLRARQGQRLTVSIAWKKDGDNRAEFTVSRSANFSNAEPVRFGTESNGGKSWTGLVPATRRYYIYVVAHPSARYTLKVTLGK